MDRKTAQTLIENTFNYPFDEDRFRYFVINLLNDVDESDAFSYISGNHIKNPYKEYVHKYKCIGTFTDPEGDKLDMLVVHLVNPWALERSRTMLRNFAAWHLRNWQEKDAALIGYYTDDMDDWRFSFVKMEYRQEVTESRKIKVREELTSARRYSYLVGKNEPNHTAQQQIIPILEDDCNNPSLSDIEKAFSVDAVTKQFYLDYNNLFEKLTVGLNDILEKDSKIKNEFEIKSIDTANFAKILMGQTVFLYFLQKKGWFGVERDADWGMGPKNFLRQLFEKKIANYDNFFNDILESLFYEALALERCDNFYSRFNCKVPFLNGGLFNPINNYDWVHTDIILPNEFFSNNIKTKEGDVGTGILDVFDRYNFTVKEDEPLEKEVAVDPEMLGKVFENFLEVKDRKSKGTYYTPREIVHYMCQESLNNYLATELEGYVSKEDIETFIKYSETFIEHDNRVMDESRKTSKYSFKLPESVSKHAKLIDEKLASIRVCDPAVGSGAFPVGMMNEIVRMRNALTSYIKVKNDRSIYNFKRHAIQDCLYGVDIDLSAVEIAKLRLWLSLIVDEEDIKQIKPLPNLDYKIIQGHSLLGIEKNLFNLDLFARLEQLKTLHFDETNVRKKQEYKNQIDTLIEQITNGYKDFDFEVYFSEVFHEKKGFDVVISNPPYIGESGHKEIFREIKQGPLEKYYHGKMDIFYFFFHKSLDLLKNKGIVSFITTNYYITATGAYKLRKDFHDRTIVLRLINFNELKIFSSAMGQHNMITILMKGIDCKHEVRTSITNRTGIAGSDILRRIVCWQDEQTNYYTNLQKDLYEGQEFYIRLGGITMKNQSPIQVILQKIKSHGKLLGLICNINQGVVTGANFLTPKKKKKYKIEEAEAGDGIFLLTNEEVKELNLSSEEKKLIKPLFKNSDIHKYYTSANNKLNIINLRYTDRLNIDDYPNIKKHLLRFRKLLIDRPRTGTLESAFSKGFWYVMTTSRKLNFESSKIVVPYRSPRNTFGYNEIPWFGVTDIYFITEKDKTAHLKYVLALLNSKLYYLWLYHKGKRKGEVLETFFQPLSEIPIKKISSSEQQPFISLVEKIIFEKQADPNADTTKLEAEIDQMVYELYGLTEEEIAIVEDNIT